MATNRRGVRKEKSIDDMQTVENDTAIVDGNTSSDEQRVFKNEDLIPCKSIATGVLVMEGLKSGDLYRWTGYGDIVEVEYRDLVAEVRAKSNYVMLPFFIVDDEDFLKQFDVLEGVYRGLYSVDDIEDLFRQDVYTIKRTIAEMPEGARDSVKSIAATMIKDGTLDSVSKIRALDEIFGCQLILLTGLYD